MDNMRKTIFPLFIGVIVLILVISPYFIASRAGGGEVVFTGFLFNPLDGNSYLAKIYQGWRGDWLFRLPFTAEPGNGAFLFLFYLGLGHLSRLLGIPLLTTFHLARILGCVVLLFSLWNFYGRILKNHRSQLIAFALASLGSGMGWLFVSVGAFTSDFWVAETFPFLSSYANPHFPLGLAMVLWLIMPVFKPSETLKMKVFTAIGALTLSVINPFGVVITVMVLAGHVLYLALMKTEVKSLLIRVFLVCIFGLPILVYDLWVASTDPAFMSWNAQNLTRSPPVWDLIVSLSPALIFGVIGALVSLKSIQKDPGLPMVLLVVWSILGLVTLYLPFGLQRRFMMGLYVPLAGLTAFGLEHIAHGNLKRHRLLTITTFLLAFPTNLIVLIAAWGGIHAQDPQIYLTPGEVQAINWIQENTAPDDLILSSPEMGLFIPGMTGRRVIYGHPYETVGAEFEEAEVRAIYSGEFSKTELNTILKERGVAFVFLGLRERSLGTSTFFKDLQPVFSEGEIVIYQVNP